MEYCRYYQAHVVKPKTWFFVATLRSFEHCCFDRTLDAEQGLFEFFVPIGMEELFLGIMQQFQDSGILSSLNRLPNRMKHSDKC